MGTLEEDTTMEDTNPMVGISPKEGTIEDIGLMEDIDLLDTDTIQVVEDIVSSLVMASIEVERTLVEVGIITVLADPE